MNHVCLAIASCENFERAESNWSAYVPLMELLSAAEDRRPLTHNIGTHCSLHRAFWALSLNWSSKSGHRAVRSRVALLLAGSRHHLLARGSLHGPTMDHIVVGSTRMMPICDNHRGHGHVNYLGEGSF